MKDRFSGALQFLTVLPITGRTVPPSRAAVLFPLIGALLGISAGAVFFAVRSLFGQSIAALLTIAWLMAITGCLHEDGLADVADAFRAGRTREKILLILKDSRIGAYGAVALIVSILLRWQSLAQCRINPLYGLIAAITLSRAALVTTAAVTPAVGDGLGQEFVNGLEHSAAVPAVLQGIIIAFVAGWQYALTMILASAAIVLAARTYFTRRMGGVNGDCLGATCQAVETVNLLILTWRYSI